MTRASDNIFPRLLISEGGSTATPDTGNVTVYAKTDGLLYSKDDAGVETLVSGGTGGAGGGWTQVINESGASVANWTARDGTWSSTGTVIQQTNNAAEYHLQYTIALIPLGEFVAQCDMWIPSVNSTDDYIGMDLGMNATNTANTGLRVYLKRSGTSLIVGTYQGGGETGSPTVTVNTDTWYTVRVHVAGQRIVAWLDGTLAFTRDVLPTVTADSSYFGLFTALSTGQFRNIKLWTPDLPT